MGLDPRVRIGRRSPPLLAVLPEAGVDGQQVDDLDPDASEERTDLVVDREVTIRGFIERSRLELREEHDEKRDPSPSGLAGHFPKSFLARLPAGEALFEQGGVTLRVEPCDLRSAKAVI